jgi:hypothetical protein
MGDMVMDEDNDIRKKQSYRVYLSVEGISLTLHVK